MEKGLFSKEYPRIFILLLESPINLYKGSYFPCDACNHFKYWVNISQCWAKCRRYCRKSVWRVFFIKNYKRNPNVITCLHYHCVFWHHLARREAEYFKWLLIRVELGWFSDIPMFFLKKEEKYECNFVKPSQMVPILKIKCHFQHYHQCEWRISPQSFFKWIEMKVDE